MFRQHSLLRKDVLQTFGGFLWKVMPRNAFCLWSFFNVTETEISSKKRQTSTILVIRLFCIKTFSSGVFFRFIHVFRRLFPMNSTWKRNSKGQQSHTYKLLSSFLVSMRAIYFRALRMSAAIAFKGSPRVCGYAVNSRILETIIQQLLRLNRDSGWGNWW